jgi:hypothetical protein
MILDVDDVVGDLTALIISLPTGIFYTAQTGGMDCNHPQCEGLAIALPERLQNFDDCSYGCNHLWQMPEAREKLANDLDAFFISERHIHISIDRDKLSELSEGWWPVVYNRHLGDSFNGITPGPFKGYIHTGNCD